MHSLTIYQPDNNAVTSRGQPPVAGQSSCGLPQQPSLTQFWVTASGPVLLKMHM